MQFQHTFCQDWKCSCSFWKTLLALWAFDVDSIYFSDPFKVVLQSTLTLPLFPPVMLAVPVVLWIVLQVTVRPRVPRPPHLLLNLRAIGLWGFVYSVNCKSSLTHPPPHPAPRPAVHHLTSAARTRTHQYKVIKLVPECFHKWSFPSNTYKLNTK